MLNRSSPVYRLKVAEVLRQLGQLVHQRASVSLTLLAGPEESFMSGFLATKILEPATFFAITKDAEIGFARDGRLETHLILLTSVSQELSNEHISTDGWAYGQALNGGRPAVKMRDLKAYAQWHLQPIELDVHDEGTYHGLWPEFAGIRRMPEPETPNL